MQSDEYRLARRQGIRRRIAECQLNGQRADIIRGQIVELDQRADAAAAVHQETCQPIQERLAEVEAAITTALTDRQPVDQALASEQAELLGQIHRANEALQAEVARIDQLRQPLQAEEQKLRALSHSENIRSELVHPDNANPAWVIEKFTCARAQFWGEQRLKHASEQLEFRQFELDQAKEHKSAFVDERVRAFERWQAEVAAARSAIGAAHRREAELHRLMLDE